MPIDFNSVEKLIRMGEILKFRPPREDESFADYRKALADFNEGKGSEGSARHVDPVQAAEIRFGVGWDKWSDDQMMEVIGNNREYAMRNPMLLNNAIRLGLLS